MRIANLEAGENWQLLVTADDGRVGMFDLRHFLDGFVFRPLKDLHEFRCQSHIRGSAFQARITIGSAPSQATQPQTR
jgi:hypothetical protein